jgi:putative ABC transport system permease protein
MLKNLLLSSWRSIQKNRMSSAINFTGLVFGFICALVIGIYVWHELTYDQFHRNADRIYRVTYNEKAGEIPGTRHLATISPPVGPALKQGYSQVEDAVRFRYSPDRVMRVGDNQHFERKGYYVDPSIFNVFSFPLKSGDPTNALLLNNNIVITEEMAKKYFGNDDALGKVILLDNSTTHVVTGVLESLPSNAHMKFDFLLPFDSFTVPFGYTFDLNSWGWLAFHTYVLVKPGTDVHQFETQLIDLVNEHWSPDRAKNFKIQLQSLSDIYLGNVLHDDIASGNKTYIMVLTIAGCFILLIAIFNFTNLYAVINITRAKEMGVRGVMGAPKSFVSRYFTAEAVSMAMMAMTLGICLLFPVLNYLNASGFSAGNNVGFATLILVASPLALLTGWLASLYPSSVFKSFNHQQLLKGTFRTSPKGIAIRKLLVVVQFCSTIALISSVLIIDKQMTFIGTKDLGYAKDELLLLQMPGNDLHQRFSSIKAQLSQNPYVTQVSMGGGRMDGDVGNVRIFTEGNMDEGTPMAIDAAPFDFFKTIGVKMLRGREISEQFPGDTLRGVIINESAARELGWAIEDAIGKKIQISNIVLGGEVIGVIPDFNFGLLKTSIRPLVMYYPRTRIQNIYVRFNRETDINTFITSLEKDWASAAPEFPFDYTFLNEHLTALYKAENFFFLLFKLFAIVAIVVSCLGLFALVSQDVVFRIKEIGIRKTLGASSASIVIHIVKPFLLLIVIAGVIAVPISWWGMNRWLNEFSYHTAITWKVFLWGFVVTLLVALASVFFKAWGASKANPVKAIRSE